MGNLRFGIKVSQGVTIDVLKRVWQIADEAGFDHCWNMDHFASLGSEDTLDIFEAWTMLAGMASLTKRVRIGCSVTGNTYRHPGVLAKMAVTVDHLSGGRLEFGIGAGWAENEHTMLGLPFGTVADRADRLEETLQIITSLWSEPTTTFHGKHYQLEGAVAEPKPVQRPHPPIWIGGSGPKRTLRMAAQYADVWNAAGGAPAAVAESSAILDRHCADLGRDPAQIRRSVQIRFSGDADGLLRTVEDFARIGITEPLLIVNGPEHVAQAEQLAELLPRLRSIDAA
ncbi:MAG TPA: LLM class F420-dependent oxidoreductase [Actinocrinis sp.]|uniref:LLM class F420-dependent oxidoreductase n=1 Tax=Actinocrinis sp. TaxID=1920516 RepID=UPI002D516CE5|nr:LLM class F420-dependent oxidoreductase [Actinocrinis sp.]HZU59152.1 LLM class F420-dependent oxidoreductase [Actinocrinis sp.]